MAEATADPTPETPWRNRIVRTAEAPPGTLLPHPRNAKVHPAAQQAALAGAIGELGWLAPVIVNQQTGRVLDGHARLALAVGRAEPAVPVAYVDLPPEQEALALATFDPIGNLAGHDRAALDTLLAEVDTGDAALQAFLTEFAKGQGLDFGAPLVVDDPGADVDRAAELQEKWQTERGQLWVIGRHRLLCGDATDVGDVARLMAGERAALFATDPPYGIDYDSAGLHRNGSHYDAIEHDHLKDAAYQEWLERSFRAWLPHLRDAAAWYLWHPMLTQGYFAAAAAAAAAAAGVLVSRQIIWIKPQMIFGRGEYHWQHELCFYGWRQGHRPPFYGPRNQVTVWDVGYDGNRNERDHPTQKPVELWHRPMKNHTHPGEVCAEPFAGSGTQYVAAEQTGRRCYGMDIEPKYVAVTLERLAGMGLAPHLEAS